MYSPKINEGLIPELYRISKSKGKPMTKIVNEIIRKAIVEVENKPFLQVKETIGESVSSPQLVADMMEEEAKADREYFWILHLNTANKLIEKELITIGTLNSAIVHPREVFKKAIINGAASILTVHNHPGNQNKPSNEDLKTWDNLEEAGKIIGISVIDHLIITPSGMYYSRKENR